VRLATSPLSCALVKKSGNLNFLEPSGPLQACNGTAFTYIFKTERKVSYIKIMGDASLAALNVRELI
jgi:hypothetical protein